MKDTYTLFSYSYGGTVVKKGVIFDRKGSFRGQGVFCVPSKGLDKFIKSPYVPLEKIVKQSMPEKVYMETLYFTSLSNIGVSKTSLESDVCINVDLL